MNNNCKPTTHLLRWAVFVYKEVIDMRNKNNVLINTIKAYEEKVEKLERENDILKNQNEYYKTTVDRLTADLGDYTSKLTRAIDEYNKKCDELDKLKDEYKENVKATLVMRKKTEKAIKCLGNNVDT